MACKTESLSELPLSDSPFGIWTYETLLPEISGLFYSYVRGLGTRSQCSFIIRIHRDDSLMMSNTWNCKDRYRANTSHWFCEIVPCFPKAIPLSQSIFDDPDNPLLLASDAWEFIRLQNKGDVHSVASVFVQCPLTYLNSKGVIIYKSLAAWSQNHARSIGTNDVDLPILVQGKWYAV